MLFSDSRCVQLAHKNRFSQIKDKIDAQQVDPEFPFKAKVFQGTLAGAKPELLLNNQTGNLRTVFQNYRQVVSFTYANVKDGKVVLKHLEKPETEKDMNDPVLEDVEYWRRANLEYLRE